MLCVALTILFYIKIIYNFGGKFLKSVLKNRQKTQIFRQILTYIFLRHCNFHFRVQEDITKNITTGYNDCYIKPDPVFVFSPETKEKECGKY
jgi:hypothetical protein